jgi:hypothetical protein
LQKGDFVIVPVPISNPTLDTGLVAGGAYFYPQSEQQKKVQPASMTAAAAMYTSNDSAMFGLGHQSYWDQDTWRLGGAIGYANLKLSLLAPDNPATGPSVNWNIRGSLAYARLSRRWGLVGFAGGGYSRDTFSQTNDRELTPSYGISVRFMVLQAKRINLRLDYARSKDSEAIHLSVGEAF